MAMAYVMENGFVVGKAKVTTGTDTYKNILAKYKKNKAMKVKASDLKAEDK